LGWREIENLSQECVGFIDHQVNHKDGKTINHDAGDNLLLVFVGDYKQILHKLAQQVCIQDLLTHPVDQ
jgi:hypothetical protein